MPPVYEYQIIQKTGEVRWMNQRNILIRDDEGHIAAIEGIFTDLISRKKAEKQTRRLQNYLSNISDQSLWGVRASLRSRSRAAFHESAKAYDGRN